MTDFATHVHGAADRRKIRLRWYGDRFGRVERPVLEVKAKRGNVGTKLHYRLEPFDFHGHIDLDRLRQSIADSEANRPILGSIDCMVPTLFNRYQRRYYRSADGRFRLTLDTDLLFSIVNDRRYRYRDEYAEQNLIIVELKYDTDDDALANRIAAALPFRLGKFSKYLYGIHRLSGSEI